MNEQFDPDSFQITFKQVAFVIYTKIQLLHFNSDSSLACNINDK